VLPLPAGDGERFIRTGELPHHDHGHVEGIDEKTIAEATRTRSSACGRTCIRARRTSARRLVGPGRPQMNASIIFVMLLVLMLTGMPISISLGLTVLTFLFMSMTQVPVESVALKLFTGIEKFEIMAIPFFILAGNFLTHGGVANE
jgi:hypothetical protein